MKRIIITLFTLVAYLAVIVQFVMYDFVKNYFPSILTEEGYLPEYLYKVHELASSLFPLFFVVVVFYFAYSAFSKVVPESKKYLWAWVIFFGHFLTIPFFWYYYVWSEKQSNKSLKHGTAQSAAP